MFVCKSISLANFLIEKGCNIIKIDKDKVSANYVVFLFKKTKLLYDSLELWNK